jgi:hypothetical protein
MKRFAAVLLVALALGGVWLARGSASHTSPTPTWEYKVEYLCQEKNLNARGGEGWELISYANITTVAGAAPIDACIFKRPKSQ